MSFFGHLMFLIPFMSAVFVNAQEISEDTQVQQQDERIVRIDPETEEVEASERVVTNFFVESRESPDQDDVLEIHFILEIYSQLHKDTQKLLDNMRSQLDTFIEDSIETIRGVRPQNANVLRRLVYPIRDDTLIELEGHLYNQDIIKDPELFSIDIDFFSDRLDLLEQTLEQRGGVELVVDENKNDILDQLTSHQNVLIEVRRRLEESHLLRVFEDADRDGLSDYAEENIHNTDFDKRSTIGGVTTDLESLLLGLDARDLDSNPTQYEDIRKTDNRIFSSNLSLNFVEQRRNINDQTGDVFLEGVAFPGSVVYGYIFPDNIIFIARTDSFGRWDYTITRDISSGSSELVLGHMTSSGTLSVRSQTYEIIQDGDVTFLAGQDPRDVVIVEPQIEIMNDLPSVVSSVTKEGPLRVFIQQNFWFIIYGMVGFGILASLILLRSGLHRRSGTYYSTMSYDSPQVKQAQRTLYEGLDEKQV